MTRRRKLIGSVVATFVVIALVWVLSNLRTQPNDSVISTNGRIEAVEVHVATRLAGQIDDVLVREGDRVAAGDEVARLDTAALDARLRQAIAEAERAENAVVHARSILSQRNSQCALAEAEFNRAQRLFERDAMSKSDRDQQRTAFLVAEAACQIAQAEVRQSQASVAASKSVIDQIQTDIGHSTLTSPVDGRVLYRLAEPGEVLGVGGRVATIIDLSDFFFVAYLPAQTAGRFVVGHPAKVVLDAFRDTPLPAVVSFVAPEAQFTPKHVETADERQKLMYRVKLSILAHAFEPWLKPGMTGMGYLELELD